MFRLPVNKNVELVLVYHGLSKKYFNLIDRNRKHLEKWVTFVDIVESAENTLAFIQKSLHDYADGKSLVCALHYKGELVGTIGFNSIDYSLKKVELGYWLDEDYQGHGIITQASQFLISYAFEVLKMEKIQINVGTENFKSQAVCFRLGAVLEGTISNCERIGDRILSHNIYAIYNKKE